MTTELDDFETALLHELRQHVIQRRERARRLRRARVVTGVGAAAAAVVALVVLVPGAGVETAYSVQEGNSGEITVEINRPEDAAGLERALEEHGVAADITYLPEYQRCAPGRFTPVGRDSVLETQVGEDMLRVTLGPGAVRDGETFVLTWSVVPMSAEELAEQEAEDGVRVESGYKAAVDFDVSAGPVEPCQPRPAE